MYTIYKITNKLNGKRNVGYTIQRPSSKRWRRHLNNSKNPRRFEYLYCAMRKYGAENFSFDTLCWGDDHEAGLKIAEPLLIELLKPEYNMTSGGEGLIGESEEGLARRKASLRASPKAIAHRKKIHDMRRGSTLSPEWVERISASLKRMKKPARSKEHIERHAAALRGRHHKDYKGVL